MYATDHLKKILLAAALLSLGACSSVSSTGTSSEDQATIAMDCVGDETACAEACLDAAGGSDADLATCMDDFDACIGSSDTATCDDDLAACVGAGELATCLESCDVSLDDCAPDGADEDISACLDQGADCLSACDLDACQIELPDCVDDLLAGAEACLAGDDPITCLIGLADGCELPEIDPACFDGAGACAQACGDDVADCLGQ